MIKHPNFLVHIEDFAFWATCALISFYMLYINNYAAIRPFVFIGMLLGSILYFATFSLVFMKIATIIIHYIKKGVYRFIKFLMIPMIWIVRWIKIPLRSLRHKYNRLERYKKHQFRKVKRKYYHAKAEIRTDFKIRKQKK